MAKLILCADDYAMHSGVDEGILQLIRQGKLTATACMVLSPNWPQAVKKLVPAIRNKANIGLHLDFTEFAQAMPLSKLIIACLTRRIDKQWVNARIAMQLDAYEKALGTAPDYIDGHQHIHQLPVIREALIEQMLSRYGKKTPWLRISQAPKSLSFKANLIGWLGAGELKRLAQQANIAYTPVLLGIYEFNLDKQAYQQALKNWLQTASKYPLSALMCHPAIQSKQHIVSDAIDSARIIEFQTLMDFEISDEAQKLGITLSCSP